MSPVCPMLNKAMSLARYEVSTDKDISVFLKYIYIHIISVDFEWLSSKGDHKKAMTQRAYQWATNSWSFLGFSTSTIICFRDSFDHLPTFATFIPTWVSNFTQVRSINYPNKITISSIFNLFQPCSIYFNLFQSISTYFNLFQTIQNQSSPMVFFTLA